MYKKSTSPIENKKLILLALLPVWFLCINKMKLFLKPFFACAEFYYPNCTNFSTLTH